MSPPESGRPASALRTISRFRGEDVVALRAIEFEGRKGRRVSAGPDAEFEPAVRHQVENSRVLRHPHRIFQRERDDAGTEPNARRPCGDETQKGKRRRQPALLLMKVVLRDPYGNQDRPSPRALICSAARR